MRNNTLIKLLAVLVMCLLALTAFVACEEEKPVEEEPVKVVAGVAFDSEGNLVITYNDNSTQKVALPAEEECKHKSIAKHTLEEHTATANGVYLEVCNDCGYAWIKYEQRHNWIEDHLVVPPTCTADGYTTEYYCDICLSASEKKDITKQIDHVWDDGIIVVADGKNLCEDGATKVQTCIFNCGNTKETPVEKQPATGIDGQHNVKNWNEVAAPTTSATGTLTGVCEDCGKTVTFTTPILSKDDYDISVGERESCKDDIVTTYTLKDDASISYKVTTPGGAHVIAKNGDDVIPGYNRDVVNPDSEDGRWVYSNKEYTNILQLAGDEYKIDSCDAVMACYECLECHQIVDIWANAGHTAIRDAVNSKLPTCTDDGFDYMVCKDCGIHLENIKKDKLGHEWSYSANIQPEGENYVTNRTCQRTDCGITEKYVIPAADLTINEVPVTCTVKGVLDVQCTLPDGTKASYHVETDPIGHAILIGGEEYEVEYAKTFGETPDDTLDVVYKWYEGCGIVEFEQQVINSEKPVLAWFQCAHTDQHKNDSGKVAVWVIIANEAGDNYDEILPGDPSVNP